MAMVFVDRHRCSSSDFIKMLLVAIVSLLTSCSGEITTESREVSACKPEAAQKLVARPTDDEIRFLTKASVVRRIKPDDVVTQDYRSERVTVVAGPSGKVISAKCG